MSRINRASMRSKLKDEPGHTVTVFGASGQLGRYIVNRLGIDGLASEEHSVKMCADGSGHPQLVPAARL